LFASWRQSHRASIVAGAQQQESEGLGEIAGRRTVIRASIAREPGSGKGNTSQLAPAAPALGIIVLEVESMAELMGQIVSLQPCAVPRTHIDLDSATVGESHGAITDSRAEEGDMMTESLAAEPDHRKCLSVAAVAIRQR